MRSERLQRIIELKEQLMEEKERVLEQHNKKLQMVTNNIAYLTGEIDTNYKHLCTKCLNGHEFTVIRNYIEHLDRLKSTAVAHKEQIGKKIAAIRSELVEMLREIKTLTSLKEKLLSTAKKTQNKRHQKLLDEIALRTEGREV
jgi:flagellar export protein FliJ